MPAPRLNSDNVVVVVPEDWNRPTPEPDSDTERVKHDTFKRSIEDNEDDWDVDEGYDSWIPLCLPWTEPSEEAKKTAPTPTGHSKEACHSPPENYSLTSHNMRNAKDWLSAEECNLSFIDFLDRPVSNLMVRGEEAACSRSTSLDSDMVSIPDSIDHPTALDIIPLHHRDMEVIDTVSQQLFNGFTLMTIAPSPGSRHGSGYSGETRDVSDEESPPQHNGSTHGQSSDLVLSTSPTRNKPNKRKRGDEGKSDDEGDDAHDRRGPKRPGLNSRDMFRKLLACPFWKHDARRHRDCFKLKLDGIARVKQYLSRSHYSENHCERCKLVFASNLLRENHLRHEQCQWRGPDALVGISHQQRNDLSKKSKPHHSESERWFAIWAIVFPRQPAPSSPYIDPDLSQDMAEFRMYAQTHGARIVEEELGRQHIFVESQRSEWFQTLLRTALSRGQDMVFDAWLVARASPASSQAQEATPRPSRLTAALLWVVEEDPVPRPTT
ncbi:hypothetical protein PG997_008014 [Apiospora hydei]|uniref:C2H2-type domain-containing protein n=1 Tax=Apiospora hydei TaxID=1337664 RepID=A0ABR1WCF5_9PEZI